MCFGLIVIALRVCTIYDDHEQLKKTELTMDQWQGIIPINVSWCLTFRPLRGSLNQFFLSRVNSAPEEKETNICMLRTICRMIGSIFREYYERAWCCSGNISKVSVPARRIPPLFSGRPPFDSGVRPCFQNFEDFFFLGLLPASCASLWVVI